VPKREGSPKEDRNPGKNLERGGRVAALAGANEVLVTSTVKDLEIGSDLAFQHPR
jgi:hypothetical protein